MDKKAGEVIQTSGMAGSETESSSWHSRALQNAI